MQIHYARSVQDVLASEGGYVNDPDDAGGETYKGIARKSFPGWDGWSLVDASKKSMGNIDAQSLTRALDANAELSARVFSFYKINFWDKVGGDDLTSEHIAHAIFDFGVNAGTGTAIKLARGVVGLDISTKVDTSYIQALNAQDEKAFVALYALAKIKRYTEICNNKPTNKKFYFGWISRVLRGL
jgi:lysozyme family protein